jgi:UDP-N-acetylenolpyruvoylglucosamine reductase
MVPVETFEALIAVNPAPLPDTAPPLRVVTLTTLAVNEPLVSRATMVLAPFAEAAVVLALSKVPVVIAEALIAVSEDPLPETEVKVPAGWLIEQAGFKGKRFGDAGIHKNQALVLVNYGNATGQEILAVAHDIQATVLKTYGIAIQAEVNII